MSPIVISEIGAPVNWVQLLIVVTTGIVIYLVVQAIAKKTSWEYHLRPRHWGTLSVICLFPAVYGALERIDWLLIFLFPAVPALFTAVIILLSEYFYVVELESRNQICIFIMVILLPLSLLIDDFLL